MECDGFGQGAFSFFERVAACPSWDYVVSLRPDWERDVHPPMEQLLDTLGDAFGRVCYAYNLHRDPYLWSHQVGGLSVADTIVYRVVLSLEGLRAEAGWLRSSPDQVRRYRQAIAADGPGEELVAVLDSCAGRVTMSRERCCAPVRAVGALTTRASGWRAI